MKKTIQFGMICCMGALLGLTACRSAKQTGSKVDVQTEAESKVVENVIRCSPTFASFSAKARLTASLGGKELSVNGTLKMVRDQRIQLSVAPLLGIEVARIDLSRDSLLVVNRLKREYVCMSLSAFSDLVGGEVDFYTLQAMLCHQLYLPGKSGVDEKDKRQFAVETQADGTSLIRLRQTRAVNYSFTADAQYFLTRTALETMGTYALDCTYASPQTLDGIAFPTQMDIRLKKGAKTLQARVALSKMETGRTELTPTELSKKYTQVPADQLLQMLSGL